MSKYAVAVLKNEQHSVLGVVHFSQRSKETRVYVQGKIEGLRPGHHGFHVHQYGDTTNGCTSAGGHYNPTDRLHGAREDFANRHVGDLGNVVANREGVAEFTFTDPVISLYEPHSIVGRSLVIHADKDDLGKGDNRESTITGNAGRRVACGVIGWRGK